MPVRDMQPLIMVGMTEFESPTSPFRPAGGDGLHFRPEFQVFHAVLVGVAEGRALPTAEGMIGDRHREWKPAH